VNRRDFIRLSAISSAAILGSPRAFSEENSAVAVRLSLRTDRLGNKIADDFAGLSYESAQLASPQFFSGENTELIGFVRGLGKSGVLRIGGNTSEYCYWKPNPEATVHANAQTIRNDKATRVGFGFAVGPDTGKKAPAPANITPEAVRNLRDFLDATGWNLIYGLNMGTGTVEDAVAEAVYVMDVMGAKLLAFQLCNEPDLFYRNGLRNSEYRYPQFAEDWQKYFRAIRERVPNAPFAGPDTAFNTEWLAPFARQFKQDVRFISQHYYAEGPPTDPSMTIERLLQPNPKLEQEFAGMKATVTETGLPFRLAETNSCYQGGKAGVSDTFASALWGADLMYQLASEGGMGINFHGGGYGWYTPIAGTYANGFLARPIYYGMVLFAQAGPGQLVECRLEGAEQLPWLKVYALRSDNGEIKVAAFNKNLERGVQLLIEAGSENSVRLLRLYAPRADDTTDVTFGGAPVGANGEWSAQKEERVQVENGSATYALPAASAALITFSTE